MEPFRMRRRYRFLAMFLAISMLFSACGGEKTAATMYLVKTEGTVEVEDAKGKSVEVMENLGLYSGYEVTTQKASYGWINLDDTKLAKMDQGSEVAVRKDGGLLELYVQSGGLFFNVTEPLAEDEAMDIRTSTMAVGIRGTCGWVEVENDNLMCVYLLRGKVECIIWDEDGNVLASETITAGQTARMVRDGDTVFIDVAEFDTQNLPGFVAAALENPDDWNLPADKADAEESETSLSNETDAGESGSVSADVEDTVFIPWEEAGLADHVMDWQDEGLEAAMRYFTSINEGNIMLSDVWELEELNFKDVPSSSASQITNLEAL